MINIFKKKKKNLNQKIFLKYQEISKIQFMNMKRKQKKQTDIKKITFFK